MRRPNFRCFLAVVAVAFVVTVTTVYASGQGEKAASSNPKMPFAGTQLAVLTLQQPYATGFKELLPEFTKETGIQVEQDTLPQLPLVNKVDVELASHSTAYDLMFLEAGRIPTDAAFLQPIDSYITNPKLAGQNLDISDFIPSTLDAFKYDGKLFSLPFFAATQILYYRWDIFQQNGITEPPKTFAEMLADAKKVNNNPVPAIALRGQAGEPMNIWVWSQFLYGYGGRFFKDYPHDFTPTIDSPQALAALKIYVDMMQHYGIPGSGNANYDDVVIAMQQGKVAMAIEGGPLGGRILDPKQSRVVGKLGFAVPPGGPDGVYAPFTAQGLVINGASKHKEAAYLLMQWGVSKGILKQIALAQPHVAVTRVSIWNDPAFIKKYDYNYGHGSFLAAFRDSLKAGPSWYRPSFKYWPQIGDAVGIDIQKAVVGQLTPEQALKQAQVDMTQILKDHDIKID